jgi:hypothetical protein
MNPYNKEQFAIEFQDSPLMKAAQDALGERTVLTFDNDDKTRSPTPREAWFYQVTNRPVFSVVPLYYLNFLLELTPPMIADIGCGANLFKKIIPIIHGIDPSRDNTAADEFDFFDTEFSQGHTNYYPSAFSINAIHFVSITQMHNRILEFANIIKSGGRGFLALNSKRMIENTSPLDRLTIFNSMNPSTLAISDYCDEVIKNLPLNLLVAENLITKYEDEGINGNIRLVFEK